MSIPLLHEIAERIEHLKQKETGVDNNQQELQVLLIKALLDEEGMGEAIKE